MDGFHLLNWLMAAGLTAFVIYELFAERVVGTYCPEGSPRPIPQWIDRCEAPFFYWLYFLFHVALVGWMWWQVGGKL